MLHEMDPVDVFHMMKYGCKNRKWVGVDLPFKCARYESVQPCCVVVCPLIKDEDGNEVT